MSTNPNKHLNHSFFMNLALLQAQKTLGNTKENPAVGCIIMKNNHVIGAGYTSINGRPHAEQNAIKYCKQDLNNSILYVTLEPCSHYGKTPPCVNSIIKNRIKKVFFSINDIDPRSFNKCSERLKKKKITVNKGVFASGINHFYRSYINSKTKKLPFVTSKLAISKDFFTIDKKKKWITNHFSRGRVHLMRSLHDCIMTSSKTIIRDNPRLTCRIDGLNERSPARIVLDNKLRIPISSKVIRESSNYPTIIFYGKFNKKKIKLLKRLNIKVYKIAIDKNGNLDLKKSLIKAKDLGFSRIFLETGIKLTTNFFYSNLVNDFKLFVSNKSIGKRGKGSMKKIYNLFLKRKKNAVEKVYLFGEKLISYKIM